LKGEYIMETKKGKVVLLTILLLLLCLGQVRAQEKIPVKDRFPLKGTMFGSCEISHSYQKECSGVLDFDDGPGIYGVCGLAVAFNKDQTKMMESLVGKQVKVKGTVYMSIGPSECTGYQIIDVRSGKGSITRVE
jgi:hypothetical protein